MKIAIIGLPNCGKTTVFNALTGGSAETAAFSSGKLEPNQATVKVPDSRLAVLSDMYEPKKLTPAEVQYVDVGGFAGSQKNSAGLSPELLGFIGTADAFLHVVRSFEDDTVPHPDISVDPARDLSSLDLELMFSDLSIIERRLHRLNKDVTRLTGTERDEAKKEKVVMDRLHAALEDEKPLRDLELTDEELKLIKGYQLLTLKPVLVVINSGEDQIAESDLNLAYDHKESSVLSLSAKVEAELAQMDEEEAREFLVDLGIKQPARDKVISASYSLLGLISFLTVGKDEVRAWTIRSKTAAPQAGGAVHSDIERGFIRAEVVTYDDLISAGGMTEAKKHGTVRLEGKDYIVKDGDICNFLFNV
jgi:ribosome-binding ATPase